ncbi:hypothetical protein E1200_19720 [Actinomadura sp. GC306]|uniref:hypothetical protein n=1 Tax=Actinomadura sp. GC306 TaxID=2530367 RepID=UPI0010442CB2|nr:hypothetical protein [Actinomadura sp. GC306]TDC64752.1 hypothetical protein E1200_19720 [Actinomadura sp. GC306]
MVTRPTYLNMSAYPDLDPDELPAEVIEQVHDWVVDVEVPPSLEWTPTSSVEPGPADPVEASAADFDDQRASDLDGLDDGLDDHLDDDLEDHAEDDADDDFHDDAQDDEFDGDEEFGPGGIGSADDQDDDLG